MHMKSYENTLLIGYARCFSPDYEGLDRPNCPVNKACGLGPRTWDLWPPKSPILINQPALPPPLGLIFGPRGVKRGGGVKGTGTGG